MIRRRLFALVAAFAVAFGALWPLVSVAKRGPEIPSFICSQAGGVQAHPGAPADADEFHCPLCIASADGVMPVVPATHGVPAMNAVAVIAPRHAVPDHLFSARPPPTRAPPALP